MPLGHRSFSSKRLSSREKKGTTSEESGLPQQLRQSTPSCAQSCISSYIAKDCSCAESSLPCLCSRYSSDGFTLGEQLLICLHLNCPQSTNAEALDLYNICNAESSAVPATHRPLTIPATNPSATATCSRRSTPPIQTAALSSQTSVTISVWQTASTSISVSTGPSPTTAYMTTSTSIAPINTPTRSASLTTAQAVGVSIAVIGAVVIAIGAVWFFVCVKKRKAAQQKERHSYDFVDDAPPKFSTFKQGFADPSGPFGNFSMPRMELSSENRRTQWPSHVREMSHCQDPQYPNYHFLENAQERTPHLGSPTSPDSQKSDCSMRTTSQLLPDMPTAASLRPPFKSPSYILKPERAFEHPTRAVPIKLPPRLSSSTMSTQKPRQREMPGQYVRSANHLRPLPLFSDIPGPVSKPYPIPYNGRIPLPSVPPLNRLGAKNRLSEQSNAPSSSTSLLNYYNSTIPASSECSSAPVEEQTQIRRAAPSNASATNPSYAPQAARGLATSDHSNRTSFESNDPDETTPPEEEDKRLTPVAESPIVTIKYPKIPRSSNQSVARSPSQIASPRPPAPLEGQKYAVGNLPAIEEQSTRPVVRPNHEMSRERAQEKGLIAPAPRTPDQKAAREHTPTLSGSTIAAKRGVDSVANDIKRGPRIGKTTHSRTNSHASPEEDYANSARWLQDYKHESPVEGYERIAHSDRRPPNWPLRLHLSRKVEKPPNITSPLWEPKLTPRREGDDLYLDLSLASPHQCQFS